LHQNEKCYKIIEELKNVLSEDQKDIFDDIIDMKNIIEVTARTEVYKYLVKEAYKSIDCKKFHV
jgi:uncharacterized membrane-anchored protein